MNFVSIVNIKIKKTVDVRKQTVIYFVNKLIRGMIPRSWMYYLASLERGNRLGDVVFVQIYSIHFYGSMFATHHLILKFHIKTITIPLKLFIFGKLSRFHILT